MKLSDHLKKAQSFIVAMGALLSLPLFQSCLDDKNTYDPSFFYPDAIVTVKPVTDDGDEYFYFQLDDNTKLWPIDNSSLPYDEKEVRAFVKYNKVEMPADVDKEIYAEAVEVMWMDSILTKKPVVLQSGDETLDIAETYGDDPVELLKPWTVVEDGYITLHFLADWSNSGIKHEVNLLLGLNPDDPYEVRFTHNAHGDFRYVQSDSCVAFRLSDLPDTNGETVKLTVKYTSYSGEKSVQFDYRTRKE